MHLTEHHNGPLIWLASPALQEAGGVIHGFTTRFGGVSQGIYQSLNLGTNRGDHPEHVQENYRILCDGLGLDCARLVFSAQVHGDIVRVVTGTDAGKGLLCPVDYRADALITQEPGLSLMVFSADCILILLYDPVRRAVGAVHAGWRGCARSIVAKTVGKMEAVYGCRPQHMLAAIGPGIRACCFETDADVPQAMAAAFGAGAAPYLKQAGAKWHVDLVGLNRLQLLDAGLLPGRIAASDACTACQPDAYWSHRVTQGQRGSQAAVISLREERDSTP